MCDDIGIVTHNGEFLEWCKDKKELALFCPNGIWDCDDNRVDITKEVTITAGKNAGEIIVEGDMCLCDVDHYQTAFVNGFTYSKIDPDGDYDACCGYYYQYV